MNASQTAPRSNRLTVWLGRLLLAFLWLWGSEVLFWNAPQSREPLEWVLLVVGYGIVATVVLDWLVRYRVRDIWGLLVALGVFGILNGILINPTTIFAEVPRTMLSHALGAHWFIGLELFGAWLFLQCWRDDVGWRRLRWAFMVAIAMGFYWGVWVRWFAIFNPGRYIPPDFVTMLSVGVVGVLPVLALWLVWRWSMRRAPMEHHDYRLVGRESAFIVILILGLLMVRLIMGDYTDISGLVVGCALLGVFWTVLWLRDNTRKPSLLVHTMPTRPPPLALLMLLCLVMVGATWLGWHLPLLPLPFDLHQFWLLAFVFSGIGSSWMPLTAIVIGMQTFSRQMQTGKV